MSFRQIFDRIARIARSEMSGHRRSSFEEELRRAEELIEESRRPRRSSIDAEPEPETGPAREEDSEEYRRALRTIGVAPGATRDEIAAAYRQRARELHPDRNAHPGAAEQAEVLRRMQELNLAYEYLRRRFGQ